MKAAAYVYKSLARVSLTGMVNEGWRSGRRCLFAAGFVSMMIVGTACTQEPSGVKGEVYKAIKLLSVTNESQTEQVAQSFDYIKPLPNAEAMKYLCEWLSAKKATERRSAVHIITSLNWDDPSPAFEPLRKLLTHKEDTTRGMAALALGAIRDAGAYDALVRLLSEDPSGYTRRCVAFALGDMMNTDALVPLKAAKDKPDDPLVSGNIDNAVDRLTFLKENEAEEGKAKAVVEGIWIIAGTAPQQEERIERAMKCINSADEATRMQVYAKALESPSQFIRNSVMFAAIKNGETITVDEKDQQYFEIIRNLVGK